MIYMIINNGLATYKEIRDDYSFEEVIDLYETCLVSIYNSAQATRGGAK